VKTLEILSKQRAFLQSLAAIIIYRGAVRSGKTYVGAIKTIIKCLQGRTVLAIAPTHQMLIDNVVFTLLEVGALMGIQVIAKTSLKKVFIGRGVVILRSAEVPDSIRGFPADDMWIDEGSFIKDNKAYLRGYARLSGSADRQVYITSSPNSFDWVEKLSHNVKAELITQRLIDNYFLDEGFFQTLLEEYGGEDSPFARQELYGEIVNFGTGYFLTDKISIEKDFRIVRYCQAFDLAFTDKKNSDFTGYALCGIDDQDRFVVIQAERHKFEAPIIKQLIKQKTNQFDGETLIEANGPQIAVYQDLADDPEMYGHRLVPVKTTVSKGARSIGLATAMHGGRVCFHEDESWNQLALDELKSFNLQDTHEHDDIMDAIVFCYNHLKGVKSSFIKSVKGL